MAAHDHREFVPGCFRCDLSRDELSRNEVRVRPAGRGRRRSTKAATMTRWAMPDIARELGLRVETVHGYRSRKQMPEPSGVIGRTPYWTDAAIGPWIERQKTHRKHKGEA